MSFNIFIPARYKSERLPGKVLLKVQGKTLLEHAYENAKRADPQQIVIATDHYKIAEEAHRIGAKVVITSPDCPNGTARIAEALLDKNNAFNFLDTDIIVNLQADELLMPDDYIKQVAYNLYINPHASISTLAKPIKNYKDLLNPNIVKVVKNHKGMAMYFSRAPIAYIRDGFTDENFKKFSYWHHIGLYAYRVDFLEDYHKLQPASIEQAESLEQLRALWYGYDIHVGEVDEQPTHDINTQEDLDTAELILA